MVAPKEYHKLACEIISLRDKLNSALVALEKISWFTDGDESSEEAYIARDALKKIKDE